MEKRKSIIKVSILVTFIIFLVILSALYITNVNFRTSVEKFFDKEVAENNLKSIEINSEENPIISAYDKYIVVFSKGVLKIYNQNGEVVSSNDINITSPMMQTNGKYLIIAENGGKKFCVVYDNQILWQESVEGSISKININSNGYVSLIVTNTTYKSLVLVYNQSGKELFRTYVSSTYALCTDISNNNRYLALGEVDYSGTIIKSKVKIISMDLAKNDAENAIVNRYESEPGEIITDLNYQIGDNVYCKFSNYIQKVTNNSNERVIDFTDKMLFVDINLKNNVAIFEKQSSGLLSVDYQVRIINLSTKKETVYFQDLSLINSLKTSKENIGLNFVTSVQILKKNGWLSKRYITGKEIKDIVISDDIAGIVYKDKIEIIGL